MLVIWALNLCYIEWLWRGVIWDWKVLGLRYGIIWYSTAWRSIRISISLPCNVEMVSPRCAMSINLEIISYLRDKTRKAKSVLCSRCLQTEGASLLYAWQVEIATYTTYITNLRTSHSNAGVTLYFQYWLVSVFNQENICEIHSFKVVLGHDLN
jgi:hypothetical protein